MTLKGLDIQEDCIKAISNESLIFDIKNKEFLEDIGVLGILPPYIAKPSEAPVCRGL